MARTPPCNTCQLLCDPAYREQAYHIAKEIEEEGFEKWILTIIKYFIIAKMVTFIIITVIVAVFIIFCICEYSELWVSQCLSTEDDTPSWVLLFLVAIPKTITSHPLLGAIKRMAAEANNSWICTHTHQLRDLGSPIQPLMVIFWAPLLEGCPTILLMITSLQ